MGLAEARHDAVHALVQPVAVERRLARNRLLQFRSQVSVALHFLLAALLVGYVGLGGDFVLALFRLHLVAFRLAGAAFDVLDAGGLFQVVVVHRFKNRRAFLRGEGLPGRLDGVGLSLLGCLAFGGLWLLLCGLLA